MTEVRVVMVLGMHRAGTSALTRGLTALGVEVGENLLPPNAGNPKGYWEDKALVDIDERLLNSVGHNWHSYGLIGLEHPALLKANPLFFEVVQRMRDYTSGHPVWGFKDPRSARLLPFWQAVFQHLNFPTNYVIALRNPLSVARSLATRNGFAPQKSYLMWLEHYACAFKYTQGCPAVVVDYDRLIEDPLRELDRVAGRLGLSSHDPCDAAQEEYRSHFLELGLRHTQFAPQDVFIAPDMFDHVTALYEWGYKLATDQISSDDADFCQCLAQIEDLYRHFAPAMTYAHSLEVELQQAQVAHETSAEQKVQIQEAYDRLGARGVELEEALATQHLAAERLETEVVVRDTRLGELEEALATQHLAAERLETEVVVRDTRLGELEEALATQHLAAERLETEVVVRDTRLGELEEALATQRLAAERLETEVVVRDTRLGELEEALATQRLAAERLETEVVVRDTRLGELEEALATQRLAAERLETEVVVRDTRLGELEEALATQHLAAERLEAEVVVRNTRIGDLERTLVGQQGEVGHLQAAVTERDAHIARLDGALMAQRAKAGHTSSQMAELARNLHTLQTSPSWQLTRPLGKILAKSPRFARCTHRLLKLTWWTLTFRLPSRLRASTRLRRYARSVGQSGLFDTTYYLVQNLDVAATGDEPLLHYLEHGAQEGRQPHPLFDSRWYITQHPEALQTGLTPLQHYLQHSGEPGHNPHPLFDTTYYLTNNPDVAAAGHEPLLHYLEHGAQEGRQPHPLFDAAYYLSNNPDVAAAGREPLLHYLERGAQEGRQPHPLFDSRWYITQHPEALQTGLTPLQHYLQHSGEPGHNPHPLFDAAYYLSNNPDVAAAGREPLLHYLERGAQEGRQPHPLFDSRWYITQHPEALQTGLTPLQHYLQHSGEPGHNPHPLFDTTYYLTNNPDVTRAGVPPLLHYLHKGWQEGRNPHPLFDTTYYLTNNPDVARAGVPPLLHYLHCGQQEGRTCHPTQGRETSGLFDTLWHLAHNPNVLQAGMHPLFYALSAGAQAGGAPHLPYATNGPVNAHPEVAHAGVDPLLNGRFDVGNHWQPLPSASDHCGAGNDSHTHKSRRRIVFLSGEPDTPGHIYRIERYVSALQAAGFDASWVRLDEELSRIVRDVSRAHAFVIWRAAWSDVVAQAIAVARQVKAVVVFDVDDYMFDPTLAQVELIDGIRSQNLHADAVTTLYSQMQRTMLAADYCICTTLPLAKALRAFGKPTFVLPNGFDERMYRLSRQARIAWSTRPADGLIRIGYAAGTRTHQKDFAQAAAAIAQILREHAECRLVLFRWGRPDEPVATLDLEEFPAFRGLETHIEWRSFVPLEQLPQEIARFDISLAPLEVGNVYCEAKSELKYFEAALAGVPIIASPTAPFRAVIRHGITGFLAMTHHEWYNSLKQLVMQPGLREQMTQHAMHDVLWPFGPERRAELAAAAFEQMLHGGRVASHLFRLELSRPRSKQSSLPIIPEFDVVFQSVRRGFSPVAIVIPLYNYAHYVEEALESAKMQTMLDKDLIVVDDHSADHSLAVAQCWLEKNYGSFNQVTLLQNRTNSGLHLTRNCGFSFSEAPFILPLDADNRLLPGCLQRCLEALEQSGAAVAYPIIQQFGDGDAIMGLYGWEPARFRCGNYIDAMALIRKAAWAAVGGYEPMWGWEDYDLWCKFVEHGFWGIQVPEKLALYRVHQHSMLKTQTEVLHTKRQLLESIRHRHPWIDVQDRRVLEEFCPRPTEVSSV